EAPPEATSDGLRAAEWDSMRAVWGLVVGIQALSPGGASRSNEALSSMGDEQSRAKMPVEWQGDHRLLGDEKGDFERERRRVGLEPGDFLVQVRHETSAGTAKGSGAIRYEVYINDLRHPERETWKLEGGAGRDWIAQFIEAVRRRRG